MSHVTKSSKTVDAAPPQVSEQLDVDVPDEAPVDEVPEDAPLDVLPVLALDWEVPVPEDAPLDVLGELLPSFEPESSDSDEGAESEPLDALPPSEDVLVPPLPEEAVPTGTTHTLDKHTSCTSHVPFG